MKTEFHNTEYGKNFFERQLPALIRSITCLADMTEQMVELQKNPPQPHRMFLCYEENSAELARECGSVNGYLLTESLDKMVVWVLEAIRIAAGNGYYPLDKKEISEGNIIYSMNDFEVAVYKNGDENHACNYTITTKRIKLNDDGGESK